MGLFKEMMDKLLLQQSNTTHLIVMVQKLCPHKHTVVTKVHGCPGPLRYQYRCEECGLLSGDATKEEIAEYEEDIQAKIKEITGGSI